MPGPRGPQGPKPKLNNPGKLIKRLLIFIGKRYAIQYIIVVVCIFVSVYASTQGTMFMQTLIDDYITPMLGSSNPDYTELIHAITRVGFFYACGVIAIFAQNKILIYISQGTIRDMRNELFEHMQKLPVKYFDTHAHGDIMSVYTNDIDTLRQMISQSIPQMINSVVTVVYVLVFMIILNVPLTILTLVMVGITALVTKHYAGFSSRYFVSQQRDLGRVNGFIEEMMNGQKVVKVFTHEQENMDNFNTINEELYDSAYHANMYSSIMGPINAQIGNISYVLVAIVGGILALGNIGGFTLGGLASFLTFNKSFNMPISQVSQQLNSII
ncbi:MAG: ABC transporter ATP-binding protein, partial [Clostridiales bacterium]|nr:ABC transporter ATP-binding protein [Clostridiales bacterium]